MWCPKLLRTSLKWIIQMKLQQNKKTLHQEISLIDKWRQAGVLCRYEMQQMQNCEVLGQSSPACAICSVSALIGHCSDESLAPDWSTDQDRQPVLSRNRVLCCLAVSCVIIVIIALSWHIVFWSQRFSHRQMQKCVDMPFSKIIKLNSFKRRRGI